MTISDLTSLMTPSTLSPSTCSVGPCLNGGSYCLVSTNTSICICWGNFYGGFCELYNETAADEDIRELNLTSNSVNVVGYALRIIINQAIQQDNITSLSGVSNTITDIVDIMRKSTLTQNELDTVGTDVLKGSNQILNHLLETAVNQSCSAKAICQQAEQTAVVTEAVLKNAARVGSAVLKDSSTGTFQVSLDTMNITVTKAPSGIITRSNNNDDVILPASLVDRLGRTGLILTNVNIEKGLYTAATTSGLVVAYVKRIRLETEAGEIVLNVDPDDPIILSINADSNDNFRPLTLNDDGTTLTAVEEMPLVGSTAVTLSEFEIPLGKKLLLRVRFGQLPRKYERDFEIVAETDVNVIKDNANVKYQLYNAHLFIIFNSQNLDGVTAYVVLEYTDSATASNRRRRSVTNPNMRARSLAPKVWNPTTLSWEDNPTVVLSGISARGKAQFAAHFFGTFAITEVIIAPTPIDYSRLFLNFTTYLHDNSYVLALNCFLLAVTVLIVIILRKIDCGDDELWKYYPLVDCKDNEEYKYTLSFHTSIRSSSNFSATPFCVLVGSEATTAGRILSDGCRKNFRPGTVSNLYLTSPVDLGVIKEIKIWHDNQGKSTNWHLNRVIVHDMQTDEHEDNRYIFLCRKWISLEKDDGKIYRIFAALTDIDKPEMLELMSRETLFDDHSWCSIVMRPTFSRFSRVQRFLCLVAMIFISMATSAAWYQDYDSASINLKGLEVGLIKLDYRQVYVGVLSSIIIVIPGILIAMFFKRRLFKGEEPWKTNHRRIYWIIYAYITGKKLLPWWFLFVGYLLVILAVAVSAFYTFLYSLQFGAATSVNWLFSVLFSIAGTAGLVEPIKVIVLAVALSSIFRESGKGDIATVAPLELADLRVIAHVETKEVPEPLDENSEEMKKLRVNLVQKKKLFEVVKSLLGKLVYVGLLLVICLHSEVLNSYRLNTFVRSYADESYIAQNVQQRGDVWVWLNTTLIPALLPKYMYNTNLMSVYDQRFARGGANIRVGPITLRQYRVIDSCDHNVMTERYNIPISCIPKYESETAQIATFKMGWAPCNDSSCTEIPYRISTSSGGSTVDTEGTYATYGDGSYLESWDQDQTYALSRSTFLTYNDWLDINSRALIVESSLYNPNVALFTRLQVLFEFPTIGGVSYKVDVNSAKLYPYASAWDYLVLALQVLFMLIVLVKLCLFLRTVFCHHKKLQCGSGFAFAVEMLLSLTAMVVYGVKIDRTIFTVEELHNNPDSYVSFGLVYLLEDIYRFTISTVLFIRMLHLLEPLTFNHRLYVFRSTLMAARKELLAFLVFLMLVLTSFASLFYLLEGPVTYDLRSMGITYLTLIQTLLRLVSPSQYQYLQSGFEFHFKQFSLIMFYFTCILIFLNIAIAILNTNYSALKRNKLLTTVPAFDQELNDYFWDKCETFVKRFSSTCHPLESKEKYLDTPNVVNAQYLVEKTSKIEDKFEQIMEQLKKNEKAETTLAVEIATKGVLGLCRTSSGKTVHFITLEDVIEEDEEEEEDNEEEEKEEVVTTAVIEKQPVVIEATPIEDGDTARTVEEETSQKFKTPRLVTEVNPEPDEAETLMLTLNDHEGRGTCVYSGEDHSHTPCESLSVTEVTREERHTVTLSSLTPFGKVYKLKDTLHFQDCDMNIRFQVSEEPRPYEKLAIAVRCGGPSSWTCLESTSTVTTESTIVPYEVTSFTENIPEYITCVSQHRTYVHLVTTSGTEFSLPFELRSKFTFPWACVKTDCNITLKLIPEKPYPILQITPHGKVLTPVTIQFPLPYSDRESDGQTTEYVVLSSMGKKKWWTVPSQMDAGEKVVFSASLGPENTAVSFCVKPSEIPPMKKVTDTAPDFLASGALDGICSMLGSKWTDLAATLGIQHPNVYMMMSNMSSLLPSDPGRNMLVRWNRQLPVAANRSHLIKSALRRIRRFDIVEWLDKHEEKQRRSMAPTDAVVIKAFHGVIRRGTVCENWRRLAETCGLSEEEMNEINLAIPRTDAEKTFLVLMRWSQKYSAFSEANLRKLLVSAGFSHAAQMTEKPPSATRRYMELRKNLAKAYLMNK